MDPMVVKTPDIGHKSTQAKHIVHNAQ